MPKFSRKSFIGAALNDSFIELVEVEARAGGQLNILAHAALPLAKGLVRHGKVQDPEALGLAWREAFDNPDIGRFSQRGVHFSLPDLASYFHTFNFPGSLNNEEISNALAFQLEEVIPFHPDEMRGDHFVISRNKNETVVAYAMVLRSDLAAYRQAFKAAGLELWSAGLSSQAISRMLPRKDPTDPTATIMIDVANTAAAICLFDARGLRATFSQLFGKTTAPAEITDPLADNLRRQLEIRTRLAKKSFRPKSSLISQAQISRLLVRLKEIINWYEGANPPEKVGSVLLVGESAGRAAVERAIIKAFAGKTPPLAVGMGNLFQSVAASPVMNQAVLAERGALLAQACGQAKMALAPSPGDFNLLSSSSNAFLPPDSPGILSIFKRTHYDQSGFKISELTVIGYRRRAVAVGAFFTLSIALLSGAITLRIQRDVAVSAHEQALKDRPAVIRDQIRLEPFEFIIPVEIRENSAGLLGRRARIKDFENIVFVNPDQFDYQTGLAAGLIDLHNASSKPVVLAAGTALLSKEGVLFRLRNLTELSPNSSLQISAMADSPGPSGDLPSTSFTLPDLDSELQVLVTGQNLSPMSGGLIIEPAARERMRLAAENLTRQYVAGHLAKIINQQPNEHLFEQWTEIVCSAVGLVEASENGRPGLGVRVQTQIQALLIDTDDLAKLARAALAKKAGRSLEQIIRPASLEGFEPVSLDPDFSQGRIMVKIGAYPQADN